MIMRRFVVERGFVALNRAFSEIAAAVEKCAPNDHVWRTR